MVVSALAGVSCVLGPTLFTLVFNLYSGPLLIITPAVTK